LDDLVNIKGQADGLVIQLSETAEWQQVLAQLAARIDEKAVFFAGAEVTLDLAERPVPRYDLSSLKALLDRRGLILKVVTSGSQTTRDSALALDLRAGAPSQSGSSPLSDDTVPFDPEEEGVQGVLVRRTLRSGRAVHSEGHVVVIGDVNPGAKVIAAGDVIIWGTLRGMAHAGAYGDESAIVCALQMLPAQLRIAGHIATSPEGAVQMVRPEMASVRDQHIVVEAWQ
jgi:septum site-determining protein MinC